MRRVYTLADNIERMERNRNHRLYLKSLGVVRKPIIEESIDTKAYNMASVDKRKSMRELSNNKKLSEFF